MTSKRQRYFSKRYCYKKKKNNPPDFQSILPKLNKIADDLSYADYLLAEKSIQEIENNINENLNSNDKKTKKKIISWTKRNLQKAEQYLKKAKQQRIKKNHSRSILYSYYS